MLPSRVLGDGGSCWHFLQRGNGAEGRGQGESQIFGKEPHTQPGCRPGKETKHTGEAMGF